ncbi:FRG domain-containing protein [Metapseudomonas otitidis]|uniref:FRG domain-containing protein n=1 Tax=Metapseudomonas otitidis TaxID=319939 RepID=UPI002540A15A|nr:FRG domain-containing protein [Pseudomonas otitidis]WIF66768.1 FRG domain-containing protein [Pseudomonas otitidis]
MARASAKEKKQERYSTHEVNSVGSYLDKLGEYSFVGKNYWFRGVGNFSHSLIPSLFRHKGSSTKAEFSELELNLNATFRMRAFPYAESYKWQDDVWAQLFFMQHYRIPTRLLDWSGSPLVALHFALTSVRLNAQGAPETDAAVWVLNPVEWNKSVYAGTGFDGKILMPGNADARLKRYSPDEVYGFPTNMPPVALRGVHNSARIVAQQGFFTIFGPEKKSLEDFFSEAKDSNDQYIFPNDCLFRLKIPKGEILQMKNEIFSLGVSESTIYPDLEGLAAEMKRIGGF